MQNLSYFNRNRASAKMDIIDIYTRIDSLFVILLSKLIMNNQEMNIFYVLYSMKC